MQDRFEEHSVIFFGILKWFVLATLVGVVVGGSTAVFLKCLQGATAAAHTYPYWVFLLPVALMVSALLTSTLASEAEGHGTEKVIEAIHKRSGKINLIVVPVKLLATVVTMAFGGSAGKEGPCAQIGAGLSSWLADIFRFSRADRRKLVICGISGGFAAVFGTPIAGAIFGIEVLFVGGLMYDVLLPSFIAGIVSYQTSVALGVTYFASPMSFVPEFSELFFIKVVLAGVFFGLCAFLLIEGLAIGRRAARQLKMPVVYRALIGGLVLVVCVQLLGTDRYLGLGLDSIQSMLEGGSIIWYAFLLKILFTSVTLNFGGSGGIVTPIFFIGATAGACFGDWLGVDPGTFAAIGMVSVLAGAANTPIAASILSLELFGPAIGPYAATACVVSFLMTSTRSVYPSQIMAIEKSPDIKVELGKEVDKIRPRVQHSHSRLRQRVISILKGPRRRSRSP